MIDIFKNEKRKVIPVEYIAAAIIELDNEVIELKNEAKVRTEIVDALIYTLQNKLNDIKTSKVSDDLSYVDFQALNKEVLDVITVITETQAVSANRFARDILLELYDKYTIEI